MTEKKIQWIRISIAGSSFVALFGALIPFFEDFSFKSQKLVVYLALSILSFAIHANGVSFLSEIFNKPRKVLKILTGIASLMLLVFILFPPDPNIKPIYRWIILFMLFLNPIFISIYSLLESTQVFAIMKVYSFVFALFGGIYSFFISAFISRDYDNSEAGIGYMIFGVFMFFICMLANLLTAASKKNGSEGNP